MPLNNPNEAAAEISTGSYTGNGLSDQAHAHNLSNTPRIVIINGDEDYIGVIHYGQAKVINLYTNSAWGVTAMSSSAFWVGDNANPAESMNWNTRVYRWIAIR